MPFHIFAYKRTTDDSNKIELWFSIINFNFANSWDY